MTPSDSSWWRRAIVRPSIDRGHGLCGAALVALLLALFPNVIFRGEVFFERDVLIVWVAQVEAFVHSILAGSWPVWDPGVAFGHPMLGNPNTQVFYPFTWLNLLVQPLTLYVLYVLAHLVFTGLGFHVWARRVGLSASGATLSACVWVSSGPLLSFVNVWHHLAGASWLPWALWAADRAFTDGRRRNVIALSFILAIQIFAGSPDLCVFTGLVLGADAVRRVGIRTPQGGPLVRLTGAYILAVALGAAQIAPSLDLVLHSGSRPLPVEARTVWSLHPAALVQTLAPISFRELPPLAPQTAETLFDLWSPFMKSNYLGLASAILVGWALLAAEKRAAGFMAFLFVMSLIVALGRYSPAYTWLSAAIPPLGMVRYPSKAAIIAALSWAMLAGLGFDAWRKGTLRPSAGARAALCGAIVLLAAGLAANAAGIPVFPGTMNLPMEGPTWATILSLSRSSVLVASSVATVVAFLVALAKTPTRWMVALVPVLIVGEVAINNAYINPTGKADRLNQPPEILQAIPRETKARVYVWDYVLRVPGRGHPTSGMLGIFMEVAQFKDPTIGGLAFQAYLYPPSAARWGLRGSFDRDLLGLYPPWLNEMNLLLRAAEDTPSYTQLLQLGGVSRVVALHRDIDALPLLKEVPGVFRRPIQVFEVPDPWPRTYVVCRARTGRGPQPVLTLLAADFDPNQEVMVDQEVSLQNPCHQGVSRIVEDRPDRVALDVDLDGSGIVTLLDGAWDGWQVDVDGIPDRALRVNHIFRGAKLGAGHHRVTFVYRPASVLWGIGLSALAALGAALGAWRARG